MSSALGAPTSAHGNGPRGSGVDLHCLGFLNEAFEAAVGNVKAQRPAADFCKVLLEEVALESVLAHVFGKDSLDPKLLLGFLSERLHSRQFRHEGGRIGLLVWSLVSLPEHLSRNYKPGY